MRLKLPIFILCVLATHARAATPFDPDVSCWKVIDKPHHATDWSASFQFRTNAANSRYVWTVEREDGKVVASLKSPAPTVHSNRPPFDTCKEDHGAAIPATSFLKVDDGWIVGHSTYSSAVYWYNEKGSEKVLISDKHKIKFLLPSSEGSYALTYNRSSYGSFGSIERFVKDAEGWRIERHLELPAAARAFTPLGSDTYLIVTHEMLLKVSLDKKILALIPEAKWEQLHPNSIAVGDDGYIYIGMRQYVARSDFLIRGRDRGFFPENELAYSPERDKSCGMVDSSG